MKCNEMCGCVECTPLAHAQVYKRVGMGLGCGMVSEHVLVQICLCQRQYHPQVKGAIIHIPTEYHVGNATLKRFLANTTFGKHTTRCNTCNRTHGSESLAPCLERVPLLNIFILFYRHDMYCFYIYSFARMHVTLKPMTTPSRDTFIEY